RHARRPSGGQMCVLCPGFGDHPLEFISHTQAKRPWFRRMKMDVIDSRGILTGKTTGIEIFDVVFVTVKEVEALDGCLPIPLAVADACVHEKARLTLHTVVFD